MNKALLIISGNHLVWIYNGEKYLLKVIFFVPVLISLMEIKDVKISVTSDVQSFFETGKFDLTLQKKL